jgi:hypothetical protein
MDRQSVISELRGQAYPAAVALDDGRLRRNWIARTVDVLPDEVTLTEMQRVLEDNAFASIVTAYSSSVTAEALSAVRPSVQLVRLDDLHLIVRIEFAGPGLSVGAEAAISQWGVLQAVDRQMRLDDLQGLPADHWFFLRASRGAENTLS